MLSHANNGVHVPTEEDYGFQEAPEPSSGETACDREPLAAQGRSSGHANALNGPN